MKTLKFLAIFCLSALAFTGCGPSGNDDNGDGSTSSLLLVASKTTIYDNGEDTTTFSLYYEGMTLTEGYEIYVGDTLLEGNTFTSTTQGTFEAQALYGTVLSNTISINVVATPPAAPAVPEDNDPSKTNFARRILLTQFTGTGCGYCPLMVNALHALSKSTLQDKYVLAAAHIGYYASGDPALLVEAQTLDDVMGINFFPQIIADFNKNTRIPSNGDDMEESSYDDFVYNITMKSLNRVGVKGGIAVNSKYYPEEGYIVLNALVKAKETAEFRINAWLLEDGIEATQSVNYIEYSDGTIEQIQPYEGVDFDKHNNCIRLADSYSSFTGYSLGTIEAGKTASREFAFKLKTNGKGGRNYWNHDNLHIIVFISTKESTDEGNKWYVNNVVKCPKDGSVDFEYTE